MAVTRPLLLPIVFLLLGATMNRKQIIGFLTIAILCSPTITHASVPQFVTYSGRLTDGTAWGASAQLKLKFTVYDALVDGSALWSQTFDAVAVTDGYFSVMLGDGLDSTDDSPLNITQVFRMHGQAWMGVAVGQSGDTWHDLTPRQQIGAVPYAVRVDDRCPSGYMVVQDEAIRATGYYCKRGRDEMVKVGDFWIDRYESVVVDAAKYHVGLCDGEGMIYGHLNDDAHSAGFFRNGMDDPPNGLTRDDFVPLYACSVPDETPSGWLTWFQAQRACNLTGKHLCTNAEWQGAAYGTLDDETSCNINTSGPETGGNRATCISDYGAYDMAGNMWEWTANWHGQGANQDEFYHPEAGEFHGDGMWNVDRAENNGNYVPSTPFFPASERRGGNWLHNTKSGIFAMSLTNGPASFYSSNGARCCRR
jgi:formylglycine-generating enzyme required for sulfatase activity